MRWVSVRIRGDRWFVEPPQKKSPLCGYNTLQQVSCFVSCFINVSLDRTTTRLFFSGIGQQTAMTDIVDWEKADRESLYTRTVQVSADLVGSDDGLSWEAGLATMGSLVVAIATRIRAITNHSEIAVVFIAVNAIRLHRDNVKNRPSNVKADADPWSRIKTALEQAGIKPLRLLIEAGADVDDMQQKGSLMIDLHRAGSFHRVASRLARIEPASCPHELPRFYKQQVFSLHGGRGNRGEDQGAIDTEQVGICCRRSRRQGGSNVCECACKC